MSLRLDTTFADLRARGRAGFVAYLMAGDPDLAHARELLLGLPDAGADVVELGFPFSDPAADGPSIEAAGRRALAAGTTLDTVFALAADFRARHPKTPLILMGYANPVFRRGWTRFAKDAAASGADGALVVDLPPPEDAPLDAALAAEGLSLVRLVAPTTDADRLPAILENARGFLYTVAIKGVTGAAGAPAEAVGPIVARVRGSSSLPVAVGFGVKTPEAAAAMAGVGDAVVVGSAIVEALERGGVAAALDTARRLADAIHGARGGVNG